MQMLQYSGCLLSRNTFYDKTSHIQMSLLLENNVMFGIWLFGLTFNHCIFFFFLNAWMCASPPALKTF